jgi:hypothetical protein
VRHEYLGDPLYSHLDAGSIADRLAASAST